MVKKILVTGSSGTIGTRLCELLLEQGFDVVGVDYEENKWNPKIQEITLDVDLRNREDVLSKLPKDADLVIHLAANARVYNLVVEPSLARDNFETLFNTLEYARLNNVKKFMFASSREVYGNTDKIQHSETEALVKNCESPYTASKIGGEALVHSYQQCYGVEFVIFRFSNVYGMYDDSDRLVPLFIKLIKEGKDLVVFGEEKLLDFTYIDDTVNGIIKCVLEFERVKNDVYNLAYGAGTTILEVAQIVQKLSGNNKSKIIIEKNRPGEIIKYVADIDKIKKTIGYMPKVPIHDGIKKSFDWYNNYY